MPRSVPWKKTVIVLAAAVVLSLWAGTAVSTRHAQPSPSKFSGSYELGLGYMAPVPVSLPEPVSVPATPLTEETTIQEPVFGLVACDDPLARSDAQPVGSEHEGERPEQVSGGVGGSCANVLVQTGASVALLFADDFSREVAYAACVDTNRDGNCRPEIPADALYFETCGDRDNVLTFQHHGAPGPLVLFVMQETDLDSCVAVRGTFAGTIGGRLPECVDNVDNDFDGTVDYLVDASCDDPLDDSEAFPPQCSDGLDNDFDGAADYPADLGCEYPFDNSESPTPQCADGIDNDGDGDADYPADAGCHSPRDPTENPNPECADGVDNDGDGRADWPADPDCTDPRDTAERTISTH